MHSERETDEFEQADYESSDDNIDHGKIMTEQVL